MASCPYNQKLYKIIGNVLTAAAICSRRALYFIILHLVDMANICTFSGLYLPSSTANKRALTVVIALYIVDNQNSVTFKIPYTIAALE